MKLSANKVAQKLDVSVTTLTNWYKWYEITVLEDTLPKGCPPLPEYEQAYTRAPRYWNSEDVSKIAKFHKWLPKGRGGVMGSYNKKFWGKRAPKKQEETTL